LPGQDEGDPPPARRRDTQSSPSSRPGAEPILLLPQAARTGALRQTPVGTHRALGNQVENAPFVEYRESHARAEPHTFARAPRNHELKLTRQSRRLHVLPIPYRPTSCKSTSGAALARRARR